MPYQCLPLLALVRTDFSNLPALQLSLLGTTKELRKGWFHLGALYNFEHFGFAFERYQILHTVLVTNSADHP